MTKKLWTMLSLLMVFAMLLAACTPAATTEAPAEPTEEPTEAVAEPTAEPTVAPTEEPTAEPTPEEVAPVASLRIWADDTRAPILEDLAADFLAAYNVELIIELKSSLRDDFQLAAPVGEGPDILFGVAHDQAGTLVENGLLAPVDLGEKAGDFVQVAKDACTFDGILYCMPYATENMGFFYNTDLVTEPPATWDDVVAIGTALKAEGKVEYIMAATGTTYDMYPLYTAFGGYIFGKDANGNYNPQDLGVDSAGMVAGVKWLEENVKNGNLPTDWDWANNHALFETGKVPFIMAGPWALDRIRESGVKYAVTKFPAGPAGEGAPFAGTQGIFINVQSENVLLAQAFLTEFVATEDTMMKLYEAGKRPSAYIPVLEMTDDPDLAAMGAAGTNATMMPAIPEMGSVWGNWDSAVVLVRNGEQDAETAMADAGAKIRALISGVIVYDKVNVPGSYQAKAGCAGDWDPACEATFMTKGEDGLWTSGPFKITAGDYECKVAMDGGWDVNYGMEGKLGGDNYKFSLTADGEVSFVFDPATNILTINIK
jgi:maltose/maltodextrin transport system substrate-binding protein/arabinogalactan oligomer/maltooligosaccharide transport system substrate-binding protein